MKITGIYLAAGDSLRMGTNKLAMNLGNKSMGIWGLDKAIDSNLTEIIIISKDHNKLDCSGIGTEKLIFTTIKENNKGQSFSIKTGVNHAKLLHSDAVIILLADQPFITTKMINLLIQIYIENPTKAFVASCYQDCLMPPILIAKILFSELDQLQGDQGARHILKDNMDRGIIVPFEEEKWFVDIDTMPEYLYWKNNVEANHSRLLD